MDDESFEEAESAPLYPIIFEAWDPLESIPTSFNAVSLALDAHLTAGMEWKSQRVRAQQLVEKGLNIFWDIDLGLFEKLVYPIDNEMQFQALLLSLVHFRDTLWKEFRDQTVGLCLFTGSADFSMGFPWDNRQQDNFLKHGSNSHSLFCSDVAAEYFNLFARQLPDALPLFIRLDARGIDDPLLRAHLLNRERFGRIQLAVQGGGENVPHYGWNDRPGLLGFMGRHPFQPLQHPTKAICFPETNAITLSDAFTILEQSAQSYRMIPENVLTAEWDGLDYIIFTPVGMTHQTKRKLQGFCAAGGTAVTVGEKIGLPQEITLKDLLNAETQRGRRGNLK